MTNSCLIIFPLVAAENQGNERARTSSRQSERHQQLQEALQEELKQRMDTTKQRQTGRRLGLAGNERIGLNEATDSHMPYSINDTAMSSGLDNRSYWEDKPRRKAPPPPTQATPTTAAANSSARRPSHQHHDSNSHLQPHRYIKYMSCSYFSTLYVMFCNLILVSRSVPMQQVLSPACSRETELCALQQYATRTDSSGFRQQ